VDLKVYIINDDLKNIKKLKALIHSINIDTEVCKTGKEFLNDYKNQSGCLILDTRMKDISGLRVQEILQEKEYYIPLIFITAYGNIDIAVKAIKNGAADFFAKPFNNQLLLESIQEALKKDVEYRQKQAKKNLILSRFNLLTPRECEIMKGIVHGKLSKVIAYDLKISLSTVEAHRAKVMKKMRVRSLAQLIVLTLRYNLLPIYIKIDR